MEPPSVPGHRGWLPWQGLLLTAALLPFWSLPATAITMELVPPNGVEGNDIFLLVHRMPENILRVDWYKNEAETKNAILRLKLNTQEIVRGPLYSNREDLFSNGSLHIRNLTQADTGTYQVQVITENGDILQTVGELAVYYAVSRPSIHSTNTTVTEGHSSLVMVCLTNDTGIFTQWFFNNKILLPSETKLLSTDNRTLSLQPVSHADAGDYQCEISNPISSNKSGHLRLQVTPGGSATGILVWAVVSFIVGFLVGVALATVLGYFLFLRRRPGQCDPREHQPPEGSPGSNVPGSSAFQIPQHTLQPAGPIYQDLQTPDSSLYCHFTPKPDAAT